MSGLNYNVMLKLYYLNLQHLLHNNDIHLFFCKSTLIQINRQWEFYLSDGNSRIFKF